MTADVYIHSVFSTRVTSRPEKNFYGLCLEAGGAVLEHVSPLKIDSFYLASMDPALFGATGEIAAALTAELGMLPRETLGIRGTSSAGGIGVIPAFKDIASGRYDYSLVISCEQMNRLASDHKLSEEEKRKVRRSIQKMLKSVIDPSERRYGLNMILIGDMFEKALLKYLGIAKKEFLETIPDVTLAMSRRASQYPCAHFFGREISVETYGKSRKVSPHYRREDVVPPSTAACAILLSSKPPENPLNGRIVRLRGIGQGVTHPALTRRFGPVTTSPAVRRAVFELARRAGISLEDLKGADIAFPHDAFPSITRMILKEIGFSHDESIAGLVEGRFNPCGGLVKCGHPVGCSGELQLVRAFQQMTFDREAIPESLQRIPADRAFTVSVGAALTNVIATFLTAGGPDEKAGAAGRSGGFNAERFKGYLNLEGKYDRFEEAMKRIPGGAGVVLTNTLSPKGWVNLLQTSGTKAMALSEEELEIGALVSFREKKDGFDRVTRVESVQVHEVMLEALGITAPPAASGDRGVPRPSGLRPPVSP